MRSPQRPTSAALALLAVVALGLAGCSPESQVTSLDGATADAALEDGSQDAAPEVVKPPTITATLEIAPPSGNAPLEVELKVLIGGVEDKSELFVTWDFGDGLVSKVDLAKEPGGDKVKHTYTSRADYSVKVTVTWKKNTKKVFAEALGTVEVHDPASLWISTAALLSSEIVALGDEVTITFAITNDGDEVVVPFATGVWLSTDATIDTADVLVAKIEHPGIASGQEKPAVIEYTAKTPFVFNVPAGLADGGYTILLRVDVDKVVNEVNRADNENFATTQIVLDTKVTAKADLIITAPDFDHAKTYSPGDTLKYTHSIANIGDGEAKSLKFGVFASADQKLDYDFALKEVCTGEGEKKVCVENPKQIDKLITRLDQSHLQKIAPKSSLPLTYSTAIPPLPDGTWYLIAKVDLLGAVDETHEDNNTAVSENVLDIKKITKEGVDLALVSMTVKPKGSYLNGSVSVEWHVKNSGTVATPVFPATIYFCPTKAFTKDACVYNVTQLTVPPLAVGEEKKASQIVQVNPQTPVSKTWHVYMQIDPEFKIAELSESNNIGGFENLIIEAQASVDLSGSDVGFHPGSAVAGSSIKVSHVVKNAGTSGSGASKTWYALSPLPSCSVAGVNNGSNILVKKADYAGIDGLESGQVTEIVPIPVGLDHAIAEYHVCVLLDAENNIPKETNKSNNTAVSAAKLKVLEPKGGCFEDAHDAAGQSNNTAASAVAVEAGKSLEFGSCGNDDWWKISVPKGHSLFATLQTSEILWTTPVSPDLDIDLLTPDGKTVIDSIKVQSPLKKAAALTVAEAGDYLIRVYGHTSAARAQYTLLPQVVAPPAGIDLLVTGLGAAPQATWPGGLVKTKLRITNLGDQATGAFTLRYVLTADTTVDAGDAVLEDRVFPEGVGVASSVDVLEDVLLPIVPGGKYVVAAVADPTGAVAETDENNNIAISNGIILSTTASCASDAYSGNHTVDTAVPLATQTATYPTLNVCPGLEDWFAVEVPEGKAFSVKATWKYQAGKGLVGVQIADASKTGIVAGSANPLKTEAKIPYVQSGGTYYAHIYVLPEGGQALPHDYDLVVTVTDPDPTDVCLADYYEPGNSAQSAPEIGCGVADLTLCLGDEDWFKLDMTKGETIAFDFENKGAAFQLKIFGNPKLAALKSLASNGSLSFVAPDDGTYYMQVAYKSPGAKPQTFAYKLKVDGGKGIDLLAKIESLFPGQVVQGEDVYLTAKITNECKDAAGPFEYAYYYSLDNKLDAGDKLLLAKPLAGLGGKSALAVDDKAILPIDAKPGPAYILVAADATQTVVESQELNNTGAAALDVIELCLADVLEPNGAPQAAAPLPMGKTPDLALCPYELDWLSVPLVKGDTLTLTAVFDTQDGDIDMRLYKAGKFASPVAVSATKKSPEQIIYTADETTKYFVRINGFVGDAAAYSLFACKSVGSSCVECLDDSVCGDFEECDPKSTMCGPKACTPADSSVCEDGNQCTVDSCGAEQKCSNVLVAAQACSDGNACTLGETCDSTGSCVVATETTVIAMASDVTLTDLGADVTLTADGGYLVVGAREGQPGQLQGHLARFDAQGKLVWSHLYSAGAMPGRLQAATVMPGTAELVAVGYSNIPDKSGLVGGWVLRVALADGAVVKSTLLEVGGLDAHLRAVAGLEDGSVVVAGQAYEPTAGNGIDGWLARVGADGTPVWSKFLGGKGNDALWAVTRLGSGSVAAVGVDETAGAPTRGLFVRAAVDGAFEATATVAHGDGQTLLYGIALAADGTLVVAGTTDSGPPVQNPPGWQALVLRLDGNGKVQSAYTWPATTPQAPAFAGPRTAAAYDVFIMPDGSVVVAGTNGAYSEKTAQTDATIWVLDQNGAPAATFGWGKAGRDSARAVVEWGGGLAAFGSLFEGEVTSDAVWLQVLPPKLGCDDLDPCTNDSCDAVGGCLSTPALDGDSCGAGLTCIAGVCQ